MKTDPLLPEQPRSRCPLDAKQVGLIVLTGVVIGFVMGMALAVTVHFLTK